MNPLPPYLQAGPVAIHIRSREITPQLAPPSSDYPFIGPTLDVQGSVLLSPDNGAAIEELNGVVIPSNAISATPSTIPSPVPSQSSPVASSRYPSFSSSLANASHEPATPNTASIPPGAASAQGPNLQQNSSPGPQATYLPNPSLTLLPGARGNSSDSTPGMTPNPVPASSQPSGVNRQPTILAGSTTAVPSDLTLAGSISATSTSGLETASPTVALVNSATNRNTMPIIIGSILAATIGVALIIAVITWFLRMRSRRRSDDDLSWDPEPNSDHSYDGDSFFDSPSPFRPGQDRAIPPTRPRPPDPPTGFQPDFAEPRMVQTPYSRLATPELAHTTGPLTVTNLMPGDVPVSANTSIFTRSRPGSTQVTPRIDNSAPRFTRLQDGGLPVPWSQGVSESTNGVAIRPKAWPPRLSAASLKKAFSSSPLRPIQPDPLQSRTSAANLRTHFNNSDDGTVKIPEPARTADHTWSGTIRIGITNALNAVMRSSGRPPEPLDDSLTPIRPRPNRRFSSKTGISTDSTNRMSTPSTTTSYNVEEMSQGHGIVRVPSLGWHREKPRSNGTIKEETEEERGGGMLSLPGFSPLEKAPAVMRETPALEIPRVPDDVVDRPSSVPRLPTIRPLSRAWTLRREGFITLPESDDGYRSAFNQMIDERKQEYDQRLAELEAVAAEESARPVMSRASTTSLMTESTILSRQSSAMDEEERKAKRVLRMRRKRAMALSATGLVNGKITGRRTNLRTNTVLRGV